MGTMIRSLASQAPFLRRPGTQAAALAVLLWIFTISQASGALLSRLGGAAYYDEEQDITWIADFNLAATNTFGLPYSTDLGDHPDDSWGAYIEQIAPGGNMNWGAALWWIDAMNEANYLGANTWRLPDAPPSDGTCDDTPGAGGTPTDGTYGYDCTGSEMGYLYYVHGISASTPGPFSNVQGLDESNQPEYVPYWTGREYAGFGEFGLQFAHIFIFSDGYTDVYNKYLLSDPEFAVAVLDGDISASAVVPVPPAALLFGTALGLLAWIRHRTD